MANCWRVDKSATAVSKELMERVRTRTVFTIDAHTVGEVTRVVVGGLPPIRGSTMASKRLYMQEHLNADRQVLMHEPRGHRDMFGAVITDPVHAEADLGVIFMDTDGYLHMCGHGTIGVVTVAIESGLVKRTGEETPVTLDTPAGLIRTVARIEGGRVREVRFTNVPAFLARPALKVPVPGWGEITVDVAFGGNFFAVLRADALGLHTSLHDLPKLVEAGMAIRTAANQVFCPVHPVEAQLRGISLTEFYGEPEQPGGPVPNVVVFGEGSVDRSPCGTGTCAKMAAMYFHGHLGLQEEYQSAGILGTVFRGRLLKEVSLGPVRAVVPEITGSAYITGYHQFIVDSVDPLAGGFLLASNPTSH
jgi:proline racemase